MARQDYGNDLANNILQPGWKLSDDGFGLHTITATYKTDNTTGFNFLRGDPFTVGDFSYCKLHKQTSSFDALGIQTVVCEFVGIPTDVNSGLYTNAQMTTAGGLTTEKIETIPNFTLHFATERYNLADSPPYTKSAIGPLVSIKNPADFVSQAVTGGAVAVTKQQSFIGANGACFENEDGGKFLGFVDPAYPYFYGKTSYLAAQQTFSGIVYVADDAMANKFLDLLSTSSGTGDWAGNLPYIIPTYLTGPFTQTVGSGEDTDTYNQLLLTQTNIESFGDLYKVTYEIKFSVPGWHPAVYNEATAPE
jgi:hypothetical protein